MVKLETRTDRRARERERERERERWGEREVGERREVKSVEKDFNADVTGGPEAFSPSVSCRRDVSGKSQRRWSVGTTL